MLSEDSVKRLFILLTDLQADVRTLSERVVKLETTISEREKTQTDVRGVVAWIATTGIALYAAVVKH